MAKIFTVEGNFNEDASAYLALKLGSTIDWITINNNSVRITVFDVRDDIKDILKRIWIKDNRSC